MQDGQNDTLASVRLPPLPARRPTGGVAAVGVYGPGGVRIQSGVAGVHRRTLIPPIPPPRSEVSLAPSRPPRPENNPLTDSPRPLTDNPRPLTDNPRPETPTSQVNPVVQSGPGRPDQHISLSQPRPGGARQQNLYVDTPFKGVVSQLPRPHPGSVKRLVTGSARTQSVKSQHPPPPVTPSSQPTVISKQPLGSSSTLKKPSVSEKPSLALSQNNNVLSSPTTDSIICTGCGRCRCVACRTPRPLPQVWLCNNSCLCSAESVLDTTTCMCCVKGIFYHCGQGEDECDSACVDKPCSCSPNKRCLRWGCMSVLALPLPCLLCYLPMRGLSRGLENLYQRCTSQGCRCPAPSPTPASPSDSQKRLLG